MSEAQIAQALNALNIPWLNSKPWARMSVRHILTNPKYIGASVYNRTSSKLQNKRVKNPKSEWIWCAGAFEPIVPVERFEQAHDVSVCRARVPSSQEMLDGLKVLMRREGKISERLIDKAVDIPSSNTYCRRFGSLRNAFRLVGWKADRQENLLGIRRAIQENQAKLVSLILEALSGFDPQISINKTAYLCTTSSGIAMSLVVTRCSRDKFKLPYWHVYSRATLPAQIRVIGRLTPENDGLLDFFIFPNGVLKNSRLSLGTLNSLNLEGYRFQDLDVLAALLQSSYAEDNLSEQDDFAATPEPVVRQDPELARLVDIRVAMGALIADEDFRNLLRAENISNIPDILRRQNPHAPDRLALAVCEEYVTRLLRCERISRFIDRRHHELLEYLSSGQSNNSRRGGPITGHLIRR